MRPKKTTTAKQSVMTNAADVYNAALGVGQSSCTSSAQEPSDSKSEELLLSEEDCGRGDSGLVVGTGKAGVDETVDEDRQRPDRVRSGLNLPSRMSVSTCARLLSGPAMSHARSSTRWSFPPTVVA